MLVKNFFLLVIIFSFTLSGCGNLEQSTTQIILPTVKETTSFSPMITPIQVSQISPSTKWSAIYTPSPMKTFMPSKTTTPQVSITSTITKTRGITKSADAIPECVGKGQPVQPNSSFGIPGTILYQLPEVNGLFTLGEIPLKKSQFSLREKPLKFITGFSPEGKLFGYIPWENEPDQERVSKITIYVISSNGDVVESELDLRGLLEKLDEDYRLLEISPHSYWINDHLIYLMFGYMSTDPHATHIYTFTTIIDPFKGILELDLLGKIKYRADDNEIGFSPDLSKVMYINGYGLYLKDLTANELVYDDVKFKTLYSTMIRWAPDGSMAAALLTPDQYDVGIRLVSKDGTDQRIIKAETFNVNTTIDRFYWSPDSQFLALITERDKDAILYLYDVLKEKVIYRCPIIGYGGTPAVTVWSPNNEWIATSAFHGKALQVLNIKTGQVFELANNALLQGWSNLFPIDWKPKK